MSEVPSTPPELSCPSDTSTDSLLERLRRITGITEMPPLRDLPCGNVHVGAPPVDKLIPWVRDGFAALTAGAIALAVAGAAATLWLFVRSREIASHAKRWRRGRSLRASKAREAPIRKMPSAAAGATNGAAATTLLPDVSAQFAELPAPAKPIPESAVAADVLPLSVTPVSTKMAAPSRVTVVRRLRRSFVVASLVVLSLPSLLLVKPVRYFFSDLMGWGNAAVIVGRDGWLFPRVEAEPVTVTPPALHEIAAALQAHGAALVVISVPAKSAVYPEMLTDSGVGELRRQPVIAAALTELSAAARVIDLGPVMFDLKISDGTDGYVFAPESSWWSPRSMAQGAFAAAKFIQQQPGYASLPLRPALATLQPCFSDASMDDLVTALESTRMQSRYPTRSVPLIRLLTSEKKEPLASDLGSPVVLLGGEPVAIYDDPALGHAPAGIAAGQRSSAGFGQHLAWHLSISVDLHVSRGGGLRAARNWLSDRSEDDRRRKKLVIWVLADSDLLREA